VWRRMDIGEGKISLPASSLDIRQARLNSLDRLGNGIVTAPYMRGVGESKSDGRYHRGDRSVDDTVTLQINYHRER